MYLYMYEHSPKINEFEKLQAHDRYPGQLVSTNI